MHKYTLKRGSINMVKSNRIKPNQTKLIRAQNILDDFQDKTEVQRSLILNCSDKYLMKLNHIA